MLRYAITDRRRLALSEPEASQALVRQAAQWASEGINFVQLREKDLAPGALASLARQVLVALHAHATEPHHRPRLLINSRADVAVAVGADGVHLTSAPGQLTPGQIRELYASAGLPDPIVSVSCHTLAEVTAARDAAANLILFGPVFEKVVADTNAPQASHTLISDGVGLDVLREACTAAGPIPVLALGGITFRTAAACMQAGAAGIAAIRLFSV